MTVSTQDPETAIGLYCFYAYGYKGRTMRAVRAPFMISEAGEGLVGRLAWIQGKLCRVVSIMRQIDGPTVAGDALGVEISLVDPTSASPPGPQDENGPSLQAKSSVGEDRPGALRNPHALPD
jgi:hypothetical protein